MSDNEPRVKVRICTPSYRVDGEIAQFAGERLTDFMISAKSFLAVTAATVYTIEGRKLFSTPFLNVQRDKIELIVPQKLIEKET